MTKLRVDWNAGLPGGRPKLAVALTAIFFGLCGMAWGHNNRETGWHEGRISAFETTQKEVRACYDTVDHEADGEIAVCSRLASMSEAILLTPKRD